MSLGYILYEGPSLLDGVTPIVVIANCFNGSSNPKTGAEMIQTWILHAEESPLDAIAHRTDEAVCGQCPHRGDEAGKDRTCYVNVQFAPQGVWRAYKRGSYPVLHDLERFRERLVRFGSYGDPAAAPTELWTGIADVASGHTGYTHQWKGCDQRLRAVLMASCDSSHDREAAKALGWRTFRVVEPWNQVRHAGEVVCPASEEAGNKLTCAECLACGGTGRGRRGDVQILAHGSSRIVKAYPRRFKGIPIAA